VPGRGREAATLVRSRCCPAGSLEALVVWDEYEGDLDGRAPYEMRRKTCHPAYPSRAAVPRERLPQQPLMLGQRVPAEAEAHSANLVAPCYTSKHKRMPEPAQRRLADPRRRPAGGSVGARFWGQVRGFSGRLRALEGRLEQGEKTTELQGKRSNQAHLRDRIEAGRILHGKEGVDGSSPSEGSLQ
jgi:hypothetical protein